MTTRPVKKARTTIRRKSAKPSPPPEPAARDFELALMDVYDLLYRLADVVEDLTTEELSPNSRVYSRAREVRQKAWRELELVRAARYLRGKENTRA